MAHAAPLWSNNSNRWTTKSLPIITTILWIAAVMHSCAIGMVMTGPLPPGLPTWFPAALAVLIGLEVLAFYYAARNIDTGWPMLVAVVALKIGGVLFSIIAWNQGLLDARFALPSAAFDAIWSTILIGIITLVVKERQDDVPTLPLAEAISTARDQTGQTLLSLSNDAPVLVVFLRHFGCTFCREALTDLAKQRPQIESAGTTIALVHMGTEDEANFMLASYGLSKIHHISDPLRRIYRSFQLRRGTISQLFGLRVWWRGFRAGVLEGHGLGRLQGDGFQMPGAFLLRHGKIVSEFRHQSASDRPDYRAIATSQAKT